MFNSIPLSLRYLRATYHLGLVLPEYKDDYHKELGMEYSLFKIGRGADEIIEANAEAEAY